MSPLFPPQAYRKTEFTHRIGLAADRPVAADVLVGTLYFSTDTLILERSNGVTWDSYSPSDFSGVGTLPFTPEFEDKEFESFVNNDRPVSDGYLSSNVALKNRTNAFTGANSFANTVVDLLVGQLKFPATQNPSSDANTLDDYEEGSWTPVLSFGGGTTGIIYSAQTARYIKVGRIVYIEGRIILTSKGSSVGAAAISGLPFTSTNESNQFGGAFPSNFGNFVTAFANITCYILNNGTAMNLFNPVTALNIADTDFNNTTDFAWVGGYRATA